MAHKDSNHSSTERTILWIIIPATIGVSLLFTRLNHKMSHTPDHLKADYGIVKKEVKHEMPATHEMHEAPKDTTSTDTLHVTPAPAPAAEGHNGSHH
jgi:hypothetical protein